MRRAVALAVVAAAGCSKADSVVVVSVTAEPAVPAVTQIRVTMSNAGVGDVRLYPQATSATGISFPTAFSIIIPRARSGALDLALEGMSGGTVVANGSARAVIVVGGRTDVTVQLALGPALCGNHMIDPGEQCDDGNRVSGDGCDFMCRAENPVDGGADRATDGGDGGGEGEGAPEAVPDLTDPDGVDGIPESPSKDGAGTETAPDLPVDAGADGPLLDTPPDVPVDTAPDSLLDLAAEPAADLAADAPPDVPKDLPIDAASEPPVDLAPDRAPLGAPCTSPAQCASGFCTDGYCCVSAACSNACFTCAAGVNGKMPGTCEGARCSVCNCDGTCHC